MRDSAKVPTLCSTLSYFAKILLIPINCNQDIKGIAIDNSEIKNIKYADDLSFPLKDETSM